MSLMRRFDPFEELNEIQRNLDRVLGKGDSDSSRKRRRGAWRPAVELKEKSDSYQLDVDLPGMTKDDVEVKVTDDSLTVEGERSYEREEEDENVHYVERSYGKFSRSFTLPSNSNPEDVSANFEDGVLKIRVGKSETEEARTVAIE